MIDLTTSMKYGRPPAIQATGGFDVQVPLAVNDQYIMPHSVPRQPADRPSRTAFFIETIKMSHVVAHILRELYATDQKAPDKTDGLSQADVIGRAVILDGKLRSWWNALPEHLRPESCIADRQDFQR